MLNKENTDSQPILSATAPQAKAARVWQIDALRGTAMILMTVFHALVDIRDFFGFADVRYYEPPLVFIGRSSAILFMFVSGISCRFSKDNVRRGIKVILCGFAVTIATYFFVKDLYVRFGILHFLGTVMVLIGIFEKFVRQETVRKWFFWFAAPLSLLLGFFFSNTRTENPFLFIFGIITPRFQSYDYYPLFPWGGVVFAGYALGLFVYERRERLASMRKARFVSALCSLGRVSLIYYLVHQPALLAVFYIFNVLFRIALNL